MSQTESLGYTPVFQINRGGIDITSQFNDRVTLIKVVSKNGGGNFDTLDISIDDRDWIVATPNTDSEGSPSLELFMGYAQSGIYSQGNFSIYEIHLEGTPKTMRLVGSSVGFSSPLKSTIMAAYDSKTLGDIVQAQAQAAGLSATVDPDLSQIQVPFLEQNQSPMHVLQYLERTYNGLVKYGPGTLSFTKRGSGENASGNTVSGFALTPEDFGHWDFKVTNRTAYSGVKAGWFDSVNLTNNFVTNTTAAGGSSSAPFTIRKLFPSQSEAQAAADAQMQSLNRGLITGTIVLAKGDPSIHGGAPFSVSGMKDIMNGNFIANTVTHTFAKQGGITTTIEFMLSGDPSDYEEASPGGQLNPDGLGYSDPGNVSTGNTPVSPASPTSGAGSA